MISTLYPDKKQYIVLREVIRYSNSSLFCAEWQDPSRGGGGGDVEEPCVDFIETQGQNGEK